MEGAVNWLAKNLAEFISVYLNEFLDVFGGYLNQSFKMAALINDIDIINDAAIFVKTMAYVLLTFATIKQLLDIYGFHTSGDANENPVEVIYRASVSSVIIAATDLFYTECLDFSERVGEDIGSISVTGSTISEQCTSVALMGNYVGLGVFMSLIIVIAVIVFMIIAGIRGAQLSLFRTLMPVFAVDRSLTNKERWTNFLWSYIACFLGFALQILCFNVFQYFFLSMSLGNEMANTFMAAMGWLIMAIKAPSWLDKYVFKSGLGDAVGRTIQSAGSIWLMKHM